MSSMPSDPEEIRQFKNRARYISKRAVLSGKIVRTECEHCGDPNSQIHHPDYEKPLEINWLCQSCHLRLHQGLKVVDRNRVKGPNILAEVMRAYREDENLDAVALAAEIGITEAQLESIERLGMSDGVAISRLIIWMISEDAMHLI